MIVLVLVLAEDKYIVPDIDCAFNAFKGLPNGVLEDFCGAGYAEVETLVAHEAKMSAKSGYIPRLRCQLQLVVTLIKVKLTKDGRVNGVH